MASRPQRTLNPHPAPGALRLIQDFVNTRRLDTGRDELQGPKELRAWLARRDLLPADAEIHEAAWGAAIAVRELLRTVIRSHTGGAAGEDVAERLNEAFGDGHLRLVFADGDSMRLEPVDEGWPGVLTRLRLILFEEMAAGRWQRLKTCRDADCQRVFYDAARNRLGKWCNVRRCGAPVHSRTYRRRGRAGKRGRLTDNLIRG
ncbi:MAG: CGNR zinc finger domain-containing protein [Thermoanaerobaculia bacterium]